MRRGQANTGGLIHEPFKLNGIARKLPVEMISEFKKEIKIFQQHPLGKLNLSAVSLGSSELQILKRDDSPIRQSDPHTLWISQEGILEWIVNKQKIRSRFIDSGFYSKNIHHIHRTGRVYNDEQRVSGNEQVKKISKSRNQQGEKLMKVNRT